MKIINFGSLNIDRVYPVANFVCPGETIFASDLRLFAGGKGLNQSLAAARAGAQVLHAGAIGPEGGFLVELLSQAGVKTDGILRLDTQTGHAVIQVNQSGQNAIIVFGGANQCLTEDYIDRMLALGEPGDYVLLQNEVNDIGHIIRGAYERHLRVVYNPSPFPADPEAVPFDLVTLFMVNELEGSRLAGMADDAAPEAVLDALAARYPDAAFVLTLGGAGAAYRDSAQTLRHKCFSVPVVDTTAAGDTFCGYFLSGLCAGRSIETCLTEASAAAAIAVSRHGAAPSVPTYQEVLAFLAAQGAV